MYQLAVPYHKRKDAKVLEEKNARRDYAPGKWTCGKR